MRRRRRGHRKWVVVPLIGMALPVGVLLHPDGPPIGHTGGFGEPTCQECHFDQPLNEPGGSLELLAIPPVFRPGEKYDLRVQLARPGLLRGGFQLTSRFTDGESVGRQAGTLAPTSERVQVVVDDSTGVHYAQHTEVGTWGESPDTVRWIVEWQAPEGSPRTVSFHVAANASNDDGSPFGDFIYATGGGTKPTDPNPERP